MNKVSIKQVPGMSNKYLVTNTTQLNVTTTAAGMYDYLKLFGLGEKFLQEIHVKFGNDVKKLLEIELDLLKSLDWPPGARNSMKKAKEELQKGMDAGETADEVLEKLQKGKDAGETVSDVIAKREEVRKRRAAVLKRLHQQYKSMHPEVERGHL